MEKFIVMSAAACMPGSCWGIYKRVAVVELDPEFVGTPKMISAHARGCKKVVRTWERRNVGLTERCAYQKALAEAQALANSLNYTNQEQTP